LGIALVMIFGMIGLSGCDGSNPNEGYIYGLDNARFIAHFDKSFTILSISDNEIKLINNRNELIEWQKEELRKWDEWGEVGTNHLENFDYENFLTEYDNAFFVSYQLIFIEFMGRPPDVTGYEVNIMKYANNTLTIEFITTMRIGTIRDSAYSHKAIIEITRISDNLTITFSSRDRNYHR
ncbi:MAG: hypothetical protein FWE03_01855, partial [Firmicutes bacterium]|nr:hypothetical protein [Bacillota bacterium]